MTDERDEPGEKLPRWLKAAEQRGQEGRRLGLWDAEKTPWGLTLLFGLCFVAQGIQGAVTHHGWQRAFYLASTAGFSVIVCMAAIMEYRQGNPAWPPSGRSTTKHLPPADRTTAVFAFMLSSVIYVDASDVAAGDWSALLNLPVALAGLVLVYRWWRGRQARDEG